MTEPQIARLLKGRALVFSGAGISAASGLPTFRGDGGLYEGLNPYELASPDAFHRHPATVWNWYLMRIRQGIDARPNPAHLALAELEKIAQRLTIVTSNVDPLHERAGSRRVYKLHGDILETRCTNCGWVHPLDLPAMPERCEDNVLPRCDCGGLLRPNVVWFGEYPNAEAIEAVREELPSADVVLEVGHSGTVSYGFTQLAVSAKIPAVRINPEPTPERGVTLLAEEAETALPRLLATLQDS